MLKRKVFGYSSHFNMNSLNKLGIGKNFMTIKGDIQDIFSFKKYLNLLLFESIFIGMSVGLAFFSLFLAMLSFSLVVIFMVSEYYFGYNNFMWKISIDKVTDSKKIKITYVKDKATGRWRKI